MIRTAATRHQVTVQKQQTFRVVAGRFPAAPPFPPPPLQKRLQGPPAKSTFLAVRGAWSDGLAGLYRRLNQSTTHKVDIEQIQKLRPQLAKLLREHAAKQKR